MGIRKHNEIVFYSDYAELLVTDRACNYVGKIKVSLDSLSLVEKHCWSIDSHGYAICRYKGKKIYMHRFLTDAQKGEIVDHRDLDRLNNRLNNLRKCNKFESNWNQSTPRNNTSGIKGVRYRKDRNKWVATIRVNNKRIHLGNFEEKEDAIKARKDAEELYFGSFRNTSEEKEKAV